MDQTTQHRRLTILRHLNDIPGGRANASILRDTCRGLAVATSSDQMAAALNWLAELGLIGLESSGEFAVAELRERGAEIARGEVRHPGIAVPSLKD